MAVSFFIQNNQPNKIEALEIDVTLSEGHEFSNNITSYPVDEGFNITDHIQQQSPSLSITGLTSNTPVQYFSGSIGKLIRSDFTNRIQETFKLLLNYAGFQIPKHPGAESIQIMTPKLLTIVTGYMVYKDMAIRKVSFPREKATGGSIQYTLDLVQIRKVSSKYSIISVSSNQSGKAPNTEKQSSKTVNAGKNTTSQASNESLAYKGLGYLKGLIK